MNYLYKTGIFAVLLMGAAACADYSPEVYEVEKPVSVEQQEAINAYGALTSYVSGDLMIGADVDMSTYMNQDVRHRLINSNFHQVSVGTGLNHGDLVQADGSISATDAGSYVDLATESGLMVQGHGLVSNTNQNSEYLNATIAPVIIPATGGPEWEEQISLDFETDDATGYQSNSETNATLSFTADGGGADGTGRALVVTNSAVRDNDWQSQLFVTFETPTAEGDTYRLKMNVRADDAATMATQAQTAPGAYKHWNFFGSISATTEWAAIEVEITIDASTSECNTIAFNLGNTATSYYFDDIVVEKFNENASGPVWEVLSGNDFESDDASNYESNGENAILSFSADGEGANGTGRALIVNNAEVRADDWRSQLFFTFGEPTFEGQQLRLTMDVRADADATMATQAQTSPGAYKHWNFFGAVNATTEWTTFTAQITVDANTSECNTIAFNLGNTATNYYFDNIEVTWYNEDGGGEQIIERTPEEKSDTLSYAMETYIAAVLEGSGENVKSWDVIVNPMDDSNPSELKSANGEEAPAGEFYWQDYLGMDYGVLAFNLARQYASEGSMLFVSDNQLTNPDKCQGLIDYVSYIEDQGASVDGIGTQMNISLSTSREEITAMFETLAETGKKIKISHLTVSLGGQESSYENLMEQANMYKFVLDAYAASVPATQRYSVSISGVFDSDALQGLWYSDLDRKPAYMDFADALYAMD